MIPNLPAYLPIAFGLITLLSVFLFWRVIRNVPGKSKSTLLIVVFAWLLLQGILGIRGIYSTNLGSFPPKLLLLGILPPILAIVFSIATRGGREFVDKLPLKDLTYLSTIRIFVELSLFGLFLEKTLPQLMTFEGGNLDILSGITAPIVAYFGISRGMFGRKVILAWNFICLALLFNIVTRALLSTPLPIQRLAFDQPNIAILNFPFVWLPTFIVPSVLFSHVVSIRKLFKSRDENYR